MKIGKNPPVDSLELFRKYIEILQCLYKRMFSILMAIICFEKFESSNQTVCLILFDASNDPVAITGNFIVLNWDNSYKFVIY